MTETVHTAGPWEAQKPYTRTGQWKVAAHEVRGGQRRRIAILGSPVTYKNDDLAAENEANARLIAAAPDMLEALKMAMAWRDGLRDADKPLIEFPEALICAAIAKATS